MWIICAASFVIQLSQRLLIVSSYFFCWMRLTRIYNTSPSIVNYIARLSTTLHLVVQIYCSLLEQTFNFVVVFILSLNDHLFLASLIWVLCNFCILRLLNCNLYFIHQACSYFLCGIAWDGKNITNLDIHLVVKDGYSHGPSQDLDNCLTKRFTWVVRGEEASYSLGFVYLDWKLRFKQKHACKNW